MVTRLMTMVLMACVLVGAASARQDDQRLETLFVALGEASTAEQATAIELDIWSIWLEGGREDINRLMAKGMTAMRYRHFDTALESFTSVISLDPKYAEGWNKRATVHWLMDNLSESMDDIRRTLALEPRHFGAISGMGLIFMERGDDEGALQAFEAVLEISPASEAARARVEQLRTKIQGDAV